MLGVINLGDTPRVDASSDGLAVDLNLFLGSNDSKRHERAQFTVVLDGLLIVLLNIVREIVNRDVVVFNVLHDLRRSLVGVTGN